MIRTFSFFTLFLLVQSLSAQELVDGFCKDGQGYFEFTDGEYFGECKNRTTMHGEGKYILYSGETFSGKWKNGKKNGFGIVSLSEEWIKYEGDWVDGQMHGLIRERMPDDTYEFFIYKNGKKTDLEKLCISGCDSRNVANYVFVWKSGDRYEGNKKDGYRHGKGTYEWRELDGSIQRYIGDFVVNERTGKGKYLFINGDIGDTYEGDHIRGSWTGKGKYTWASGQTYEGDWVDGYRTGFGVYRSNSETYEGMYKDSQRHGIGISSYPDGSYEIQLNVDGEAFYGDGFCSSGDCENGRGTYVYKNGEYYEGKWKAGKRDGAGTLVNLTYKTSEKSLWSNDIALCNYSLVEVENTNLVCGESKSDTFAEGSGQKKRGSYEGKASSKNKVYEELIFAGGIHGSLDLLHDQFDEEKRIMSSDPATELKNFLAYVGFDSCIEKGSRKIISISCSSGYSTFISAIEEYGYYEEEYEFDSDDSYGFVSVSLIEESIFVSCETYKGCSKSLEELSQKFEYEILFEEKQNWEYQGTTSKYNASNLSFELDGFNGEFLCADIKNISELKDNKICFVKAYESSDEDSLNEINGYFLLNKNKNLTINSSDHGVRRNI